MSDTYGISALLHEHGALAFWDFAAAAPYVDIEMTAPDGHPLAYKDAIFFSGHKFVGGPGSPGVLVVKKAVVTRAAVPTMPGGGTVLFVSEKAHRYLKHPVEREAADQQQGGDPRRRNYNHPAGQRPRARRGRGTGGSGGFRRRAGRGGVLVNCLDPRGYSRGRE